jgi:hypothetical protein
MPSQGTNRATRREWRELGFFYLLDKDAKEWRVVGSVTGLRKFARLVQTYASDPRSIQISEHIHLGPYGYLEIGTWHVPLITEHWIAGPLPDLLRLFALLNERIAGARIGEILKIREAYAPASPYELILELRDDAFDPARADTRSGRCQTAQVFPIS